MSSKYEIHYSVHPTSKKPGETTQTYHVRQNIREVMHNERLKAHIADYTLITGGLFEMVMHTLKKELAEQLRMGKSVHLDGIGRFSLQIGTVKKKDEAGHWRTKTYTDPDELKARELCIDGISFVPDKEMMDALDVSNCLFVRDKGSYNCEIPRGRLLKTLADYCAQNGSFTRRAFQFLFKVSRYKADEILTALVNEPYPKYYREKQGTTWVYRKTGT